MPTTPADLVITGARVWTGDPAAAERQALAIGGDRVIAVGGQDDVLRAGRPAHRAAAPARTARAARLPGRARAPAVRRPRS